MSGWEPSDWNSSSSIGGGAAAQDSLADLDSFARDGKTRMFSVDTLERNASKGHGLVTSVAAANNILLIGTNKGWLVHHDFAGTNSNDGDSDHRYCSALLCIGSYSLSLVRLSGELHFYGKQCRSEQFAWLAGPVEEEQFDSRMDLGSPTMLGLCSDTADGAFYAFDENFIYEITVQDEDRDMWQTTQVATFEEVALKFVLVGESINWLLLVTDKEDKGGEKEENSAVSEYRSIVQEFWAFLSDCKDVLDEAMTTVKLLGRGGSLAGIRGISTEMVVKRKKPAEKRGIQWNGLNNCHKINIIVLIVDELFIIDDTAFTDLKGFITLPTNQL
ncbi:unnamed protein product [Sphagnum jensenii]